MPLQPRRAILTLVAAGSIILAAPALSYAQASSPTAQASAYSQFGDATTAPSYAGLSFGGPAAPFGVRQDDGDNEMADNDDADNDDAVADNDNSYDDDEDANNENGNDNSDFANEADFLKNAVTDSATEMQAGQLARDHGNNIEVQQFGDRMAREHEATMQAAATVAARHGVETSWAPAGGDEQQRIADLTVRSGDEFDRYYLRTLVLDQRADIDAYRAVKANATDDVAEFSNQHLWMLEDQLRAAEDLADRLDIDVS